MSNPTLWSFFLNASAVVKFVLLLLIIASVVSWTIIFQRALLLMRTRREMKEFEQMFWTGDSVNALMKTIPADHSDLARIFHAGFQEYQTLRARNVPREVIVDSAKRAMQINQQQSLQLLESNVSILATIGSTAPYVGLFGTVWGILTSFQALGSVQQASIAMVAPGISEALIATAIGLFAAIPAVIGYNRLTNLIDGIAQNLDIFQEELLGLIEKQSAFAGVARDEQSN